MSVIKQYNTSTSQWETIVVGKQGPVGETGATGPTGPSGETIDEYARTLAILALGAT